MERQNFANHILCIDIHTKWTWMCLRKFPHRMHNFAEHALNCQFYWLPVAKASGRCRLKINEFDSDGIDRWVYTLQLCSSAGEIFSLNIEMKRCEWILRLLIPQKILCNYDGECGQKSIEIKSNDCYGNGSIDGCSTDTDTDIVLIDFMQNFSAPQTRLISWICP